MISDAPEEYFKLWASQNPIGRIGQAHEVRGAVVWFASDASSFCTGSEYVLTFLVVDFIQRLLFVAS